MNGQVNVAEVVARVERQYLEHPDELWVRSAVTQALDASSTSFTINMDLLGPEEQNLLTVGVLVQVDYEQMVVTDFDALTATVTVSRGARGTDADTHDDGAELLIAPPYTRDIIFNAVAESIVGLHPPLYEWATEKASVGENGIVSVSDEIVNVFSVRSFPNQDLMDFEDLGYWPDDEGNAVRSIRVFEGVSGQEVWITYRGKFRMPTSPNAVLAQLGVKDEWARIVVVGAAAQLIASKPMSPAWKEYVSNQMRSEAYPVETPNRIRDALVAYHEFLINRAAASLHQQHPMSLIEQP